MKKSFLPIITKDTHSLFLGSLPGEKSLAEQQYYAHPQNKFWMLLTACLNLNYDCSYQDKIGLLLKTGFGLWDVLQKAKRQGSLDSAIKEYEVNDFEQLLQDYPNLKTFYFTSKQAYQWYFKKYKNTLNVSLVVLASPSPANARLNFEQKLTDWKSKIKP